MPDDESLERILQEITLDPLELAPGERATMSLLAPEAFLIVFDPVAHMAMFTERERQTLTAILNTEHAPTDHVTIHPGPLRISFEYRAKVRTTIGRHDSVRRRAELGQLNTARGSRNASRPNAPNSRPMPDCLKPPNGASGSCGASLMTTRPACNCPATRFA